MTMSNGAIVVDSTSTTSVLGPTVLIKTDHQLSTNHHPHSSSESKINILENLSNTSYTNSNKVRNGPTNQVTVPVTSTENHSEVMNETQSKPPSALKQQNASISFINPHHTSSTPNDCDQNQDSEILVNLGTKTSPSQSIDLSYSKNNNQVQLGLATHQLSHIHKSMLITSDSSSEAMSINVPKNISSPPSLAPIESTANPISSIISSSNPSNIAQNHQPTTIPNNNTSNMKPTPNANNKTTNNINQMGDIDENDQNIIMSQLQQLQSPPPKLDSLNDSRDSPISQVTKPPSTSRHRGFLSQLLCCFRPTPSNIYDDHQSNKQINNNNSITNSIYGKNQALEKSNENHNESLSANNIHHSQQLDNRHRNSRVGKFLLPTRKSSDNRICLVIDLDETLVHSSFKRIENADFIVPVEIYGTLHDVYVLKRPHVDEFLRKVGQLFECVLFTASLAKYADPVADLLDKESIFKSRLFREACSFYRGNYVKDLSRLGRDLGRVIIVDNSPASYIFHPDNAVSIHHNLDYLKSITCDISKPVLTCFPSIPPTVTSY